LKWETGECHKFFSEVRRRSPAANAFLARIIMCHETLPMNRKSRIWHQCWHCNCTDVLKVLTISEVNFTAMG